MELSQKQIAKETKRLKELGKIDGLIGGKNIGKIIDFHNEAVDKKKEKRFDSEVNSRNKYFLPMIRHAMKYGSRTKYKSSSRLFSKQKVIH